MKKITLSFIVVLFSLFTFVSTSNAEFSAGLKIGLNGSKFRGDPELKFVPGIHIGPYFRVGILDKYRIQGEVLFSSKGSSFEVTDPTTGSEKFYILPLYVDVPVFFNYKPIPLVGLFVEAGVQTSINITTVAFSANTSTETQSDYMNRIDVAPLVGVGYEFKKASIGFRSIIGVTEAIAGVEGYKNLGFMLTFGFKF